MTDRPVASERQNRDREGLMEQPDATSGRTPARTAFEQQWRERFVEFASERDDDAGIAGWSRSGLATRFRFFRTHWSPGAAGGLYLDLGCGAGTYAGWLAGQGMHVVGIDYSQPTLIKARARIPSDVLLCAADAKRLPLPDARLDGAICFGVLQAVSDSGSVIRELARVVRPGGEVWIDALNRGGLSARFEQAKLKLKRKGMHLRYESPGSLAGIMADAGFDPSTRHWLPIVPARLQWLQGFVETGVIRGAFNGVPALGGLLSHAFVFHARRRGR